jgi:hypothetical protein
MHTGIGQASNDRQFDERRPVFAATGRFVCLQTRLQSSVSTPHEMGRVALENFRLVPVTCGTE